MEELEKLQCVKDYNIAMDAVHKGDNESAENWLKIAISTLMFEITMTVDEKRVEELGKLLRHARATLNEVKYINHQFSSGKTI